MTTSGKSPEAKAPSAQSRLIARLRALSAREQVILAVLVLVLAGYAVEALFFDLFLERRNRLREDLAVAEETLAHQDRILSRAEWIRARYEELGEPVAAGADSALGETEVLRRLSELAAGVHLTSVVPRDGVHEGRNVLLVALDFEGPLPEVTSYLDRLLAELPLVVNELSLAPQAGGQEGVVCRTSVRIDCHES